jgi:hypothetical protein
MAHGLQGEGWVVPMVRDRRLMGDFMMRYKQSIGNFIVKHDQLVDDCDVGAWMSLHNFMVSVRPAL